MSDELKAFVEFGDTTELAAEGQGSQSIFDTFSTPPLTSGYGAAETTILASTDKYRVIVINSQISLTY